MDWIRSKIGPVDPYQDTMLAPIKAEPAQPAAPPVAAPTPAPATASARGPVPRASEVPSTSIDVEEINYVDLAFGQHAKHTPNSCSWKKNVFSFDPVQFIARLKNAFSTQNSACVIVSLLDGDECFGKYLTKQS